MFANSINFSTLHGKFAKTLGCPDGGRAAGLHGAVHPAEVDPDPDMDTHAQKRLSPRQLGNNEERANIFVSTLLGGGAVEWRENMTHFNCPALPQQSNE